MPGEGAEEQRVEARLGDRARHDLVERRDARDGQLGVEPVDARARPAVATERGWTSVRSTTSIVCDRVLRVGHVDLGRRSPWRGPRLDVPHDRPPPPRPPSACRGRGRGRARIVLPIGSSPGKYRRTAASLRTTTCGVSAASLGAERAPAHDRDADRAEVARRRDRNGPSRAAGPRRTSGRPSTVNEMMKWPLARGRPATPPTERTPGRAAEAPLQLVVERDARCASSPYADSGSETRKVRALLASEPWVDARGAARSCAAAAPTPRAAPWRARSGPTTSAPRRPVPAAAPRMPRLPWRNAWAVVRRLVCSAGKAPKTSARHEREQGAAKATTARFTLTSARRGTPCGASATSPSTITVGEEAGAAIPPRTPAAGSP